MSAKDRNETARLLHDQDERSLAIRTKAYDGAQERQAARKEVTEVADTPIFECYISARMRITADNSNNINNS